LPNSPAMERPKACLKSLPPVPSKCMVLVKAASKVISIPEMAPKSNNRRPLW